MIFLFLFGSIWQEMVGNAGVNKLWYRCKARLCVLDFCARFVFYRKQGRSIRKNHLTSFKKRYYRYSLHSWWTNSENVFSCVIPKISVVLWKHLHRIKDNTWTLAFATKFLISASCFFTHQRKEALNKQSTHFENIAFIACLKKGFLFYISARWINNSNQSIWGRTWCFNAVSGYYWVLPCT